MEKLLILISVLFCTGCATLFTKSEFTVNLESEPKGVEVSEQGKVLCTTPCEATLHKGGHAIWLTFKKEGYETKKVLLEKNIEPVAFFNFGYITTTFGVTSWGIDFSTDKMFRFGSDSYVVQMESEKTASLDFAIQNFAQIKRDLSDGSGKTLNSWCFLEKMPQARCKKVQESLAKDILSGVEYNDGLELYRALQKGILNS